MVFVDPLINCITAEDIKTNSIYSDDLSKKVRILIFALMETNFDLNNIPDKATGNKLDITLGKGNNRQTFYLAKNNADQWYFTEKNFTNKQSLEKYNDFTKKNQSFVNDEKLKNLSIPLLVYMNFILGF